MPVDEALAIFALKRSEGKAKSKKADRVGFPCSQNIAELAF